MDLLYLTHIDLSVVVLIFLIIIFCLSKKRLDNQQKQSKLYLMLIIMTAIIIILEIADTLLLLDGNPNLFTLTQLINFLGFSLAPVVPFLWQLYLDEYLNIKNNYKILTIPLILNLFLCALSLKYGFIFSVDILNSYERGPLFMVPIIITSIYLIYSLYFLKKHKARLENAAYTNLSIFGLLPFITMFFQLIFPQLLLVWPSVAISIIIHYIYLQEQLLRYDALTGVWNRMSCELFITNHLLKKQISFGLVVIDLDDFKTINDTFGHLEGDIALKNTAIFLTEYFANKGKVVRIGGDEFIVIVFEEDKNKLNDLLKPLKQELYLFNQKLAKDYTISLSYGFNIFNEQYNDFNMLLQNTDELMYHNKLLNKNIT